MIDFFGMTTFKIGTQEREKGQRATTGLFSRDLRKWAVIGAVGVWSTTSGHGHTRDRASVDPGADRLPSFRSLVYRNHIQSERIGIQAQAMSGTEEAHTVLSNEAEAVSKQLWHLRLAELRSMELDLVDALTPRQFAVIMQASLAYGIIGEFQPDKYIVVKGPIDEHFSAKDFADAEKLATEAQQDLTLASELKSSYRVKVSTAGDDRLPLMVMTTLCAPSVMGEAAAALKEVQKHVKDADIGKDQFLEALSNSKLNASSVPYELFRLRSEIERLKIQTEQGVIDSLGNAVTTASDASICIVDPEPISRIYYCIKFGTYDLAVTGVTAAETLANYSSYKATQRQFSWLEGLQNRRIIEERSTRARAEKLMQVEMLTTGKTRQQILDSAVSDRPPENPREHIDEGPGDSFHKENLDNTLDGKFRDQMVG